MKTAVALACRLCGGDPGEPFLDLGRTPLANSYVEPDQLQQREPFYPLKVRRCESCGLVQLSDLASTEQLFIDYAYLSSYSDTWLVHCKDYVDMAARRFGLSEKSLVVELASNDGYLLQFIKERGIPCFGIEPSVKAAEIAKAKGIETLIRFFGAEYAEELRRQGRAADLIIGNNVLAHVPALNDFVRGMKILLAKGGAITLQFPHLMRLVAENQFDTIYHEHLCYFSLAVVEKLMRAHGLEVFDVEELSTHGGSLRVYAGHPGEHAVSASVARVKDCEVRAGLDQRETFVRFADRVGALKKELTAFLTRARADGKSVAAYGAPAKGNTLLNFCGLKEESISFVVDRNPLKQGRYLPGSRIPIRAPEALARAKPDYVVILPWNLKEEVIGQIGYVRDWGGKFVIPVPRVQVIP